MNDSTDFSFDKETALALFTEECAERLTDLQEGLLALELHPGDEETIQRVFRAAHTIKGNAGSFGFDGLARAAHVVEDLLARVRSRTVDVDHGLVSLLLEAHDALRTMVAESIAGSPEPQRAHRILLDRVAAAASGAEREGACAGDLDEPSQAKASAESRRTLRVDVAKLDRLLATTGEIAVARGRLRQILEDKANTLDPEILETHLLAERLHADLQDQVMQARMVPVGPTFRQFARTVRDVAAARGKLAHLETRGEDVEVDTTVIEQIRDPLTHMIRNAIDHGIEPPDLRASKGKPPAGRVLLTAAHEGETVVIRVSDDGSGLDRDTISERAQRIGLIGEGATLSERDIDRLVFAHGLSTASCVTDLSGRGVGMDVVRRNVEALGGSVEIETSSSGTTFAMRMPLTLAIIRAFFVTAGSQVYAIPMATVTECVALGTNAASDRSRAEGVLDLRGRPLPWLRLSQFFATGTSDANESVVVVRHGSGEAGLVVEELLGQSEAVIKPLGPVFRGLPGLSGTTILGNGRVALILDTATLVREVWDRTARSTGLAEPST